MAYKTQPIAKTASFTLDRNVHEGNWVVCNAAAGMTVTLPASTGKGDTYLLAVGTTVTSNNFIVQVANGTDVINGGVSISTDVAGITMLASGTDDTITMNGSTKGGVKGSFVKLHDISAGLWLLEGFLVSTGAEATPFSAAVS